MKETERRNRAKEYNNSLCYSWTYNRMTDNEKERWQELFNWIVNSGPLDKMNTEKEITYLILACYHSYLIGIGYTDFNWRD